MYCDLLSSLVRIRIDQLKADAAAHRMLAGVRPAHRPLRQQLARVIRSLGYAALSLGDALAQTR